MTLVTDVGDPRLGDYMDLADPAARRRRERDELFIAEGLSAVARLVESGHHLRSILTTPKMEPRVRELVGDAEAPILVAPPSVVAATVGFNLHRGVVAAATRRPLPTIGDVLASARRVVALEGLNDPENVGLIARSARAFGIDAMVLDSTCIDPYYRRTVRVSMGEVLMLPVARVDSWSEGLRHLHEHGYETWAMTPGPDAIDLWRCPAPDRLAVLFGAEGAGLRAATMKASSLRVRIPIDADVDSINVGHPAPITFAAVTR
jgi:tRNA G18 (ribose-2'-O)-methylase SpoU